MALLCPIGIDQPDIRKRNKYQTVSNYKQT